MDEKKLSFYEFANNCYYLLSLRFIEWSRSQRKLEHMKSTKERVCYCDDNDTCNDGARFIGRRIRLRPKITKKLHNRPIKLGFGFSLRAGASAIEVCFGFISFILLYSLILPWFLMSCDKIYHRAILNICSKNLFKHLFIWLFTMKCYTLSCKLTNWS